MEDDAGARNVRTVLQLVVIHGFRYFNASHGLNGYRNGVEEDKSNPEKFRWDEEGVRRDLIDAVDVQ